MRAILLASATATTLKGRRARSCVSQGYFPGFSWARRNTAIAPTTRMRRRQLLAIDIRNGGPASETEVERWHARHPCTANLSDKTPVTSKTADQFNAACGVRNTASV